MQITSPKFGNHIVIKAPEKAEERKATVEAFNKLAQEHNASYMGDTVLIATVKDEAKDQVFVDFAKNRQLFSTLVPLFVDQIEAIKRGRRIFGLDR